MAAARSAGPPLPRGEHLVAMPLDERLQRTRSRTARHGDLAARAGHAELVRLGVDTGPPVWLDMGPDIPIDGLWALFFADPDGACLELIQTPVVS